MRIKINFALVKDLGHLHNVEIKAQEYPVDQDSIKDYISDDNCAVYKAEIGNQNRIVGLLIARFVENTRRVFIARVSVHPDFQGNLGIGKTLLDKVAEHAWKKDMAVLWLRVPSYKIDDPTDPDYIGGWLEKSLFKAVGVDHYQYYRYGREWDGYRFERPV